MILKKGLKRRILLLCEVLSCFVFITSVVSVSATAIKSWREEDRTVNKLNMAAVRGVIHEIYEDNVTVYPGSTVQKEVRVQNTGTTAAITRVKVSIKWESFTTTENIFINYNTEDWLKKGGYYYYKGILNPGEYTTELMNNFTLDGVATNNGYKGEKGTIVVNMEMLQAGGGGESAWGITYEELGLSYKTPSEKAPVTTVEFEGIGKGFSFKQNKGDLFAGYKNMVPGEAVSQLTTVTNNSDKTVEIFLRADHRDKSISAKGNVQLINSLLQRYSNFVITETGGRIVYEGALLPPSDRQGFNNAMPADAEGNCSSDSCLNINLGEFKPGEAKTFNLSLQLSPEMDNRYSNINAELVWEFSCEGESEKAESPPTGDDSVILPWIIVALASGTVFLSLCLSAKKDKDKNI